MKDMIRNLQYRWYFSTARAMVNSRVVCPRRGHDWGSCSVKLDAGWANYWQCFQCFTTATAEVVLPAPFLMAEDQKPPAYA